MQSNVDITKPNVKKTPIMISKHDNIFLFDKFLCFFLALTPPANSLQSATVDRIWKILPRCLPTSSKMSTFTRNCLEKGTAEGALAQLFRQRSRNREEIVNNLLPKNKQENLKNYSTDVNYFLKNTVRLNSPLYPEFVKTGLSDKTVIGFSLRACIQRVILHITLSFVE